MIKQRCKGTARALFLSQKVLRAQAQSEAEKGRQEQNIKIIGGEGARCKTWKFKRERRQFLMKVIIFEGTAQIENKGVRAAIKNETFGTYVPL